MLRLFQLKTSTHKFGKSFRFDFPMSGNGNNLVGVFATIDRNEPSCPRRMKLSVSTDGRIVAPSVDICGADKPICATAKTLCRPVDFEMMGNKITFVVEEFATLSAMTDDAKIEETSYTIKVYVKSKEK